MLSALKNFAVTFLLALVIFGVAGFFGTNLVTNTVSDILTSEKEKLSEIVDSTDEAITPDFVAETEETEAKSDIVGNGFNLLIVVTDYRPDLYADYLPDSQTILSASWNNTVLDTLGMLGYDYRTDEAAAIILVKADKDNASYTFTYFSPETEVYTPAGDQTLGEVYYHYGVDTVKEHINSLTGVTPDYTVTINGYNLPDLVNLLGSVTVNIDSDIYNDGTHYTTLYDPEYEYISSAGEVTVTADNIYALAALFEKSQTDITIKGNYTIQIVEAYFAKIAGMDYTQRTFVLSELLTEESQWQFLDGYSVAYADDSSETAEDAEGETTEGEEADESSDTEETEEEEEAPIGQEEPYDLPEDFWDSDQRLWVEYSQYQDTETGLWYMSVRAWDDTVGGWVSYTPIEKTTVEQIYGTKTSKPETAIFESTTLTTDKLRDIDGILAAYPSLEIRTISYPGTYTAATDTAEGYFTPSFKDGIELFRNTSSTDTAEETN